MGVIKDFSKRVSDRRTDGGTDGRTDKVIYRGASLLKSETENVTNEVISQKFSLQIIRPY